MLCLLGEIAQNYIRFICNKQVMHIVRFSEFLMTNCINHLKSCKSENIKVNAIEEKF